MTYILKGRKSYILAYVYRLDKMEFEQRILKCPICEKEFKLWSQEVIDKLRDFGYELEDMEDLCLKYDPYEGNWDNILMTIHLLKDHKIPLEKAKKILSRTDYEIVSELAGYNYV